MRFLFGAISVVGVLSAGLSVARATDYYIDSIDGDDSRTGLSSALAWETATPLEETELNPGDNVFFRRGGSYPVTNRWATSGWDPGIWIQVESSGTAGNPITFTSYGSGALPLIHNSDTGNEGASAFSLRGSYIVLDSLMVANTRGSAIVVEDTATHTLITNCEMHHVGAAVTAYGPYTVVTRNYFHDGTMIRNTDDGGDDDYGANGVIIAGSNVEVSYNVADRLETPCFDFGVDGGFVELFGSFTDVSVHHNIVRDTNGFFEGGGNGDDVQTRITFAYNLSINNEDMFYLHNGGDRFAAEFNDVLVANNTIIETSGSPTIFGLSDPAAAGSFTIENNIIVQPAGRAYNNAGMTVHRNNIYAPGVTVGVTLGTGETQASPGFVGGDDYHLGAGSPAINAGRAAAFTSDLDGVPVPVGGGVDIGAYEYVPPGTDAGVIPIDAGVVDSGSVVVVDMGVVVTDASVATDSGTVPSDGGDVSTDAAVTPTDGSGSTPSRDGGAGPPPTTPLGPSCTCAVPGAGHGTHTGALLLFTLLAPGAILLHRRKARARRVP